MKIPPQTAQIRVLIISPVKKEAGISRAKFRKYFNGCENAYAYKIGRVTLYDRPKNIHEFGITQAPQSFVYLKDE